MKIQIWHIDKLVFYVRNPRKNDAAVDRMCGSIGCAFLADELAARRRGAQDQRRAVFRLVAFATARRSGVAFGFVALAAHLFVSVHGPLLSVFSVPSAS